MLIKQTQSPNRQWKNHPQEGQAETGSRPISSRNSVIVKANGPRMMPEEPNRIIPPTIAIKEGMVCSLSRFPTRIGYMRLSMPPTTTVPQEARIRASNQLPCNARNMVNGIQITNAPRTGMIASIPITTPHNKGSGRSSHQNITPPNAPCTPAITTVPYIVACMVSTTLTNRRFISLLERGRSLRSNRDAKL